jgi:TonB family protein
MSGFSVWLLALVFQLVDAVLATPAHAASRRLNGALPDTLAVGKVVAALADSLWGGSFGWIWAAPDGTCWLQYHTGLGRSALRQIWSDGSGSRDIKLTGRIESCYPITILRTGQLLLGCTLAGYGDPPAQALAWVSARGFWLYGVPRLPYLGRTTLIDSQDVAHMFGRDEYSPNAVYLRYSFADDSIAALGKREFRGSAYWKGSSRFIDARLPGGAPWGIGRYTSVLWDGSGIVAGATTTGWSSETPEVFRFHVPDCSILVRTEFEPRVAGEYRWTGVAIIGVQLVKSDTGYWAFVPYSSGESKTPVVYSCRLDADLHPMRRERLTELAPRPFAEAPAGSRVDVSLLLGRTSSPNGYRERRPYTLRFSALGTDGRIYMTELHDTIGRRSDELKAAGDVKVDGGGDSIGPVSVYVPGYPEIALSAGIEGSAVVTTYFSSRGGVDSATVRKPSGNMLLDRAAIAAARKARLSHSVRRPVTCDLSYTFRIEERQRRIPRTSVRVVEARLH